MTASNFVIKGGLTVNSTPAIAANGVWISTQSSYSGAQGPQGFQGAVGAQGPTGVQGVPGAQGVQGAQGATGFSGVQGAQGATGVAGFQGSTGATGLTGAQGAQGAQGVSGTVTNGAQGSVGAQGATGVAGFQGRQGAQGATGAQGPAGVQGVAGAQGATGVAGVAGTQGAAGAQAPSGFQGPQGAQGATGAQGSSGGGTTQVLALGVNTAAGSAGTVRVTGSITSGVSDKRLKDIDGNIDDPLEKLNKISGVYYELNDTAKQYGYNEEGDRHIGVIAQRIQEVLPQIVKPAPFDTDKYGESISGHNFITVQYEKIVPLLIEALKKQKEQIDYLKKHL